MKISGNELVQATAFLSYPEPKSFRVADRETAHDIKRAGERMGRAIRVHPDGRGWRVKRLVRHEETP